MNQENVVQQILDQAKIIRDKSRTSCVELQNYLYYQYLKLSEKNSSVWMCGMCTRPKTQTKKQFRRAFKTLNKIQQAQFYLMNVKNVQKFLNTRVKKNEIDETQIIEQVNNVKQQHMKLKTQIMDGSIFKKYTDVDLQILPKQKIIRIIDAKIDIDLHCYIVRKSKSKNRNGIVLQSMECFTPIQTLRIAFSSIDIQDSYSFISKISKQAHYENIKKILIQDNKFPRRITTQRMTSVNSNMKREMQHLTNRFSVNNAQLDNATNIKKSIDFAENQTPSRVLRLTTLNKIQNRLVPPQIIQSLNNFQNYIEQSFGVYFDKNGNKVKKVFQFNASKINVQMIKLAIDEVKSIRKRKIDSIVSLQHLNSIPSERTNLYREIDTFQSKQYEFLYFRHNFNHENASFFFQKSIDLEEFNDIQGRIKSSINYCIWRIMAVDNKIQLLVQADISYNKKLQNPQKITGFYIGQFTNFLGKQNKHLKEKIQIDNIDLTSNQFQNQYLSEISHQEQFFTVNGSLDDSNIELNEVEQDMPKQLGNIYSMNKKIENKENRQKTLEQEFATKQTTVSHTRSGDYLKHRYQFAPRSKSDTIQMREQQGHVLWGNHWVINSYGDLVNMERQKIKMQSSVLKLVLQRMGRNILTGKSIMNMSLPIQIFGTDSNLQRIARGYSYAPIFLEKAIRCSDPVERMKYVFCCGLGFSVAYIRMQKPFNPIIGQTYQGHIDGCPVYGEQISHHPPISSMLFVGRGYRVYGNFEAKVQMGMNSASGINQGYNTIEFTHDKSKLRFNTPSGQMHGIIIGERKLSLVKKSYFIDQTNRLLCQVSWGKNKQSKRPENLMHDFFCGKIVKVKNYVNLEEPKKVKNKDIQQQFGQIHGRFTGKVYYENEQIFDVGNDAPLLIDQYIPCLQSDSRNRKDIKQRRKLNYQLAQQAKQELQKVQREDKKLRKN